MYTEIGDLIFLGHDGRDIELEVELEDGLSVRLVDWRTAHGDGRYEVKRPSGRGSVAVDSGGLAVIDKRLMSRHKYTDERINELAVFVTLTQDTTIQTFNGNAFMHGQFTLLTDPPDPEDDDE